MPSPTIPLSHQGVVTREGRIRYSHQYVPQNTRDKPYWYWVTTVSSKASPRIDDDQKPQTKALIEIMPISSDQTPGRTRLRARPFVGKRPKASENAPDLLPQEVGYRFFHAPRMTATLGLGQEIWQVTAYSVEKRSVSGNWSVQRINLISS